jgi:large subunit ribosomal protein L10
VNRQEKEETVERLRSDMGPDSHLVLTEYRGLTVEEMTELRSKIRSASGTLRVMKNTLVRRAMEGTGGEAVMDLLTGPNALAFTREDPVPMVKVLADASKSKEAVKLKGGVVEGRSVTPEEILRIAQLPSREVLLAKTLGTLAAPMQGMVNVCQGTIRNFVYVLDALRQAKSAEA